LRNLLDGVSEKQAMARPLPNGHSILELVVHVGTWMDVVARRLTGNVVDSTTVPDWSDVTKRSWRGVIEELERAQSRLCDAVARMSTDDLQSPVPGKQLSIHGALQRFASGNAGPCPAFDFRFEIFPSLS